MTLTRNPKLRKRKKLTPSLTSQQKVKSTTLLAPAVFELNILFLDHIMDIELN